MSQEQVIDRDLILANSNVLSAAAVLLILGLMVVPIPPVLLDLMLTFSIAFSLTVLLVAMYLKEPLQFNSFPSLLLILTLLRLSLNVASTRLILSRGDAGKVIQSFGDFVVGGNYVIGVIVFIILVVINFLVITKGSGRIAEVAARFTLDAMPGKQMAIDADLNAGLINEAAARKRRDEIAREAEFFGAMDGASKFVKGDAIAGIIITLVNIAAGFIIGMLQMKMPAGEALGRFTILTVGDGLVSQIPALLVSTAAGLVVTRTNGTLSLGQSITLQIFRQRKALYLAAGAMTVLALIPGLPTAPFLVFAAATAVAGTVMGKRVENYDDEEARALEAADNARAVADDEPEGPRGEDLFVLDKLELEIGYGLIPLVDDKRGGDLLHRIGNIRRQVGSELGMFIHPIRVRDNLQLPPNQYLVKLKGVEIARAELQPELLLAMSTRPDAGEIEGSPTVEPAFNLPAVWIARDRRAAAEREGYTVVECAAVLATHLSEIVRAHADELLSRQDIKDMCESVREFAPSLVEDLVPDKVSVNTLHNVLRVPAARAHPGAGHRHHPGDPGQLRGHGPGHRLPGGQGARVAGPFHHRPLQLGGRQAPRDLPASADRARADAGGPRLGPGRRRRPGPGLHPGFPAAPGDACCGPPTTRGRRRCCWCRPRCASSSNGSWSRPIPTWPSWATPRSRPRHRSTRPERW